MVLKGRPRTALRTYIGTGYLTKREAQIIGRLAAGRSQKQAARDLGIRLQTAKNMLTSAHQRCGLQSTTELVVKYIQAGNS